jgi:peptide/nickel transport system permease protein
MPEILPRPSPGLGAAAWTIAALVCVGLLAPAMANDRPLLAVVEGRMVAPALADLPIVGRLFDRPAIRSIGWHESRADVRVLLRPPVPYSYRGVSMEEALRPPGHRHWLGTDALGRDLLARLLHGIRPSLAVGFGAVAVALLFGGLLGACAGLRGGAVDLLVVRLADVAASFPPFILALAFAAAIGRPGLGPMIAGIALNRWTVVARYVRGEILRQRGGDLWASARASGATPRRLVLRHLLPLLAGPLAVMASFGVAQAIALESALSFVGFGLDPPAPSWGTILAEARGTLQAAWWPVCFTTIALVVVLGSLCAAAERAAGAGGRDSSLL